MSVNMIITDFIPLAFSLLSVAFAVFTYVSGVRHDKKRDTLDAYNRLQMEVFDKLNLYTPAQIREISKDNRSEEYKVISTYLARIEHFCVGVREKIYDKNVFYALSHGFFDGHQMKRRIEPMINIKNAASDSQEVYYTGIRYVWKMMENKGDKNNKER